MAQRAIIRLLLRLPAYLYRAGLGALLGRRFLAVTHIGRRSGEERITVLEVIDIRNNEHIVVSAYGAKADWYRNLAESPAVEVRTGRRRFTPVHRVLPAKEANEVIRDFAGRHPKEAALVPRAFAAIGALDPDETDNDPIAILRARPLVAFRPMPNDPDQASA